MKVTGTYNEGDFRARSGYLYVSIVYNISICVALWCLAVFWMCVHEDLKPFRYALLPSHNPNTHDSPFHRPVPKFLCVKGILFFSFWQSIAVSFLVAVGVITRLGPYTDRAHISLGLTDTLICIEMPFFALAHLYAFSYRDFTKPHASAEHEGRSAVYVARMTLAYALRDAFGLRDLVEDTRTTLRGEGINYRAFEPSEGGMHIGAARDRRIRAGLRYTAGGKGKYWLPEVRGHPESDSDVITPLFAADAADVVHDAPDMQYRRGAGCAARIRDDVDVEDADEYALTFSDALAGPEGVDEELYEQAKKYVFGDYLYPVVDVSSEEARRAMWEEEARVVREIRSGGFGGRHEGAVSGYGATQTGKKQARPYDDAGPPLLSSHAPQTPSPPRSRRVSECPPMTAASRSSSQAQSPAQVVSRLRLPRLLSFSAASASSSSPSSPQQQQRASKRTAHPPLIQEDAVDLVVPAVDGLQVPSTSRGGGRSPVLIRIWDELGSSAVSPISPIPNVVEEALRGEEERQIGESSAVVMQEERTREEVTIVQAQTPPAYARMDGYGFGIPGEEHNPWA